VNPIQSLEQESLKLIRGKKEETGVASLFSKGGTALQKACFQGLKNLSL